MIRVHLFCWGKHLNKVSLEKLGAGVDLVIIPNFNKMTEILHTRGQLERKLSQEIQALYRHHLGHQPSKVTCQLFDAKLAVIIEDSITNAEQILIDEGQNNLAEEVRSNLDKAIQPELKQLIETIAEVEIMDLLSDATLDTGRTGIIAVLNHTPKVRNPHSVPKAKPAK